MEILHKDPTHEALYDEARLSDEIESGLRVVYPKSSSGKGYVIGESDYIPGNQDNNYFISRLMSKISQTLPAAEQVLYASSQVVDPKENKILTFIFSSVTSSETILKLAQSLQAKIAAAQHSDQPSL